MHGNAWECTRACAFTPGAPPLDLDRLFLVARALATRALCLFLLSDVFGNMCLVYFFCYMCFMFVSLT